MPYIIPENVCKDSTVRFQWHRSGNEVISSMIHNNLLENQMQQEKCTAIELNTESLSKYKYLKLIFFNKITFPEEII